MQQDYMALNALHRYGRVALKLKSILATEDTERAEKKQGCTSFVQPNQTQKIYLGNLGALCG